MSPFKLKIDVLQKYDKGTIGFDEAVNLLRFGVGKMVAPNKGLL